MAKLSFSSFDDKYIPVIITDNSGKVIYHNKTAKLIGTIRTGTNILNYLHPSYKNSAKMCFEHGSSCMVALKEKFLNSRALLTPLDKNNKNFVFAALISFEFMESLKYAGFENSFEQYDGIMFDTVEYFKNSFISTCSKEEMSLFTEAEKQALLLKERARRHLLYFSRAISESFVPDTAMEENFAVFTFTSKLTETAKNIIKSSGIRISNEIPDNMHTVIKHNPFVFTFLFINTLAMALRFSADRNITVSSSFGHKRIKLLFTFNAPDFDLTKKFYSIDFEYMKMISSKYGFNILTIQHSLDKISIVLDTDYTTPEMLIHESDEEFLFTRFYDIIITELSVLNREYIPFSLSDIDHLTEEGFYNSLFNDMKFRQNLK